MNKKNMRKEFYDLYFKELFPILQRLEKVRLKNLHEMQLYEIAMICAIIVLGFLIYITMQGTSFASMIITLILPLGIVGIIGLMIWLPTSYESKFKNKIKIKCLPRLRRLYGGLVWGEDSQYDFTGMHYTEDINDDIYGQEIGSSSYIFKSSNLFGKYNNVTFDDTFSGVYNGIRFNVFEANMEYIYTDRKGNKREYPVFHGIILLAPSNKKIKAHTIVTTKGDQNVRNKRPIALIFGGVIYAVIDSFFRYGIEQAITCLVIGTILALIVILADRSGNKTEKVNLEDLNFDKRFSVYSEDQIEARYLITPTFMDRLYNLKTAFGTNNIKCAFFKERILFAISTNRDVFEIGSLYSSLIKGKTIEKFYKELTSIYNMIDYFKLDEKTGV